MAESTSGASGRRRARRLLPALFLTLVGVTLAARRWLPGWELDHIRSDGFAALAYISNWHDAWRDVAYFDTASSPSPFAHLWSLAIEEQIYLLWPLVLFGLYRLTRGRRGPARHRGRRARRRVRPPAMVLTRDHEFAYLATHTRAQALLMGALLAILTRRTGSDGPAVAGRGWAIAGTVGAVGLAAMAVLVHGEDRWMYRGGFTARRGPRPARGRRAPPAVPGRSVASPACARSACWASPPTGSTSSTGRVIVFLNEGRTGLDGWTLDAVRLAVVAVITTASFMLVEQPIRDGRWRGWAERTAAPLAAGAAASLLVITGLAAHLDARLPGGAADRADVPRRPSAPAATRPHLRPDDRGTLRRRHDHRRRPPPRRIVIIGDSVANSLAPGVIAAGAARGIQIIDRTVPGCGLVTNSEPAYADGSRIEFTAACRGGIQEVQTGVPADAARPRARPVDVGGGRPYGRRQRTWCPARKPGRSRWPPACRRCSAG